ncbi:MAG: hypothetical protein BZY87_06475 [SAR202 cluster bacterium Io17-Chloro-G6]|nr:MAG: hypothetical protein BZY87_06475 [SAR202 cluster bacterium Io17-Chloro-G6]
MRVRWLLIFAGLFLAMATACAPGESQTVVPVGTPVPTQTSVSINTEGVLAGSVTIGPLCPVEPCARGDGDTYASRELQIQSEFASGILVPLEPDGTFRALLPAGKYVVTLSNCEFLGCSGSLPVTIVIKDGETSDLRINIDTGIRSVAQPK